MSKFFAVTCFVSLFCCHESHPILALVNLVVGVISLIDAISEQVATEIKKNSRKCE